MASTSGRSATRPTRRNFEVAAEYAWQQRIIPRALKVEDLFDATTRDARLSGTAMIIDCHGHYTTAPKPLRDWRQRQIDSLKDSSLAPKAPPVISDDEIRESLEERAVEVHARPRRGFHDLLADRRPDGPPHRQAAPRARAGRRSATSSSTACALLYPDKFVGVCQLPQSPGVAPANCIPGAGAVREGVRVHRLQPESRSVGRLLDRSAAHGQVVVPALREDGGARRARHGARERRRATRTSTTPARTTSTATPRRSCSS